MVAYQPNKERDDSIKTSASHLLLISHILRPPGPLPDSIWGEDLRLTEREWR